MFAGTACLHRPNSKALQEGKCLIGVSAQAATYKEADRAQLELQQAVFPGAKWKYGVGKFYSWAFEGQKVATARCQPRVPRAQCCARRLRTRSA